MYVVNACYCVLIIMIDWCSVSLQILYLTEPDKWTAAAMYQATRIFASNLKANMAQRSVPAVFYFVEYSVFRFQ